MQEAFSIGWRWGVKTKKIKKIFLRFYHSIRNRFVKPKLVKRVGVLKFDKLTAETFSSDITGNPQFKKILESILESVNKEAENDIMKIWREPPDYIPYRTKIDSYDRLREGRRWWW